MNAANVKLQGGPEWLVHVRQNVESLRYGTVLITVHDGRVVQVERTEKMRFDGGASAGVEGKQSLSRNTVGK